MISKYDKNQTKKTTVLLLYFSKNIQKIKSKKFHFLTYLKSKKWVYFFLFFIL